MRKLCFTLIVLFSLNLYSNPVILPPVISEFSYNGGNWQMEIYMDEEIFGMFVWFTSFDELCLVCDESVTFFKPGIPFSMDSVYVIDQSWLTSTFKVDSIEDCINVHTWSGGGIHGEIGEPVCYDSSSILHPPAGMGESIALQYIYAGGELYTYYQMVQSPPTFGTNPFNVDARCSFSGYVFDQFGNPVEGVEFVYCDLGHCYGSYQPSFPCFNTDTNGYFECDELYPKLHNFQLTLDDFIYQTDQIFFDPQEAVYREYTLTGVGIQVQEEPANEISIFAVPNPFSQKTSFQLSMPDYQRWESGKITIRNINGQLVDEILFPNAEWSGNVFSIDWYPAIAQADVMPGLYIYNLEIDGKFIASEKMIITD